MRVTFFTKALSTLATIVAEFGDYSCRSATICRTVAQNGDSPRFGRQSPNSATVAVLLVGGDLFKKAEGSVVSIRIGMKFLLQVNAHQLTESDF